MNELSIMDIIVIDVLIIYIFFAGYVLTRSFVKSYKIRKREVYMNNLYRHYKNKGIYEFIGQGKLEHTSEDVAIYRRIANDQIWVRPMTEFFGNVQQGDGTIVLRYEKVEDENM